MNKPEQELAKTVTVLLEQYKGKDNLPERCIIAEAIGFAMIEANEKGCLIELLLNTLQLQFGVLKATMANNIANSLISVLKGQTYTNP